MSTVRIPVPVRVLKGIAQLADLSSLRFRGVGLWSDGEAVYIEAGRAALIGVYRLEQATEPFEVQVNAQDLLDAVRKRNYSTGNLEIDAGATVSAVSISLSWETREGISTEPRQDLPIWNLHCHAPWGNVLPTPSGEVANFNPLLAGLFSKACNLFLERPITYSEDCLTTIYHNGLDAAVVRMHGIPEFFGMLMPIRPPETPEEPIQDWVRALVERQRAPISKRRKS